MIAACCLNGKVFLALGLIVASWTPPFTYQFRRISDSL
jgi:hypothetical protein